MYLKDAKLKIEEVLLKAKETFAALNIPAETNLTVDSEEGHAYIYGALVLGAGLIEDDNCLFFPLDVEFFDEECEEEKLLEEIAHFEGNVRFVVEKLDGEGDVAKALVKIGDEMQRERSMELLGEVERLNKTASGNLKIAIAAAIALLAIAGAFFLIRFLF